MKIKLNRKGLVITVCILVMLVIACVLLVIVQNNNNNQTTNAKLMQNSKYLSIKDYKTLPKADMVEVIKSERRIYLKYKGDILRNYHTALGDSPKGHKVQEGDEKTPEGQYNLDYKNEKSIAYRSIHVSYPNVNDKAHAKKLGVSPGGDIMIHGQLNGYEHVTAVMQKRDWTDGCMAVTNEEMDEIMYLVKIGTPIHIRW